MDGHILNTYRCCPARPMYSSIGLHKILVQSHLRYRRQEDTINYEQDATTPTNNKLQNHLIEILQQVLTCSLTHCSCACGSPFISSHHKRTLASTLLFSILHVIPLNPLYPHPLVALFSPQLVVLLTSGKQNTFFTLQRSTWFSFVSLNSTTHTIAFSVN